MSDLSFNKRSPASSPTDRSASMEGEQRRSKDAANPIRSSGQRYQNTFDTKQMLARIYTLPRVRHQLVDDIKKQLRSGTYETPDKLDCAIGALVEEEFLMRNF